MDLILEHIFPELVSCPKLKNIGLTFCHFRKTSFWFCRHVEMYQGLAALSTEMYQGLAAP